jgi:hypothetical protein
VEAFIESVGLLPLDVSGLKMARWLKGVGVITVESPTGWATGGSLSASTNLPAERPASVDAVGEQRAVAP